jgi:NADH-quinone oxidoreductase subunit I
MTSEYDFSVFDVKDHNFAFANLTPEQADEKRKLYEQYVAEKAEAKAVAGQQSLVASPQTEGETQAEKPKPAFKPGFKPKPVASQQSEGESPQSEVEGTPSKPKPAFKPGFKPKPVASPQSEGESPKSEVEGTPPKPKPAFKPSFKKPVIPKSDDSSPSSTD